jgi:hypothetical protein
MAGLRIPSRECDVLDCDVSITIQDLNFHRRENLKSHLDPETFGMSVDIICFCWTSSVTCSALYRIFRTVMT